jgi:hypothetical protein
MTTTASQCSTKNGTSPVFWLSAFAREGGLLSYAPSAYGPSADTFHGAATYVDRILRGAKPGDRVLLRYFSTASAGA